MVMTCRSSEIQKPRAKCASPVQLHAPMHPCTHMMYTPSPSLYQTTSTCWLGMKSDSNHQGSPPPMPLSPRRVQICRRSHPPPSHSPLHPHRPPRRALIGQDRRHDILHRDRRPLYPPRHRRRRLVASRLLPAVPRRITTGAHLQPRGALARREAKSWHLGIEFWEPQGYDCLPRHLQYRRRRLLAGAIFADRRQRLHCRPELAIHPSSASARPSTHLRRSHRQAQEHSGAHHLR